VEGQCLLDGTACLATEGAFVMANNIMFVFIVVAPLSCQVATTVVVVVVVVERTD